jgi:hypothetical protein
MSFLLLTLQVSAEIVFNLSCRTKATHFKDFLYPYELCCASIFSASE